MYSLHCTSKSIASEPCGAPETTASSRIQPFQDRAEAGRLLGSLLRQYAADPAVIVLALPRGGVPVAFAVACHLKAAMDVFLVRKLCVPDQPGLAIGAIASGNVRVLDPIAIEAHDVSPEAIETVSARELIELGRREEAYRGQRPQLDVSGRTVILVDDGLAPGSTMRSVVEAVRQHRPGRIVAAVPVAAAEAMAALGNEVDDAISVFTPSPFFSVGRWYRDFSPTMDREIRQLLERSTLQFQAAS